MPSAQNRVSTVNRLLALVVNVLRRVLRPLVACGNSWRLHHLYRTPHGRAVYWDRRVREIDQAWGQMTGDYPLLTEILTRLHPSRLLDIGCGSGRLFPLYHDLHIPEVVGQDIAEHALAIIRTRYAHLPYRLLCCDISALDFPPDAFDLGISNRVLMMVPPWEIDATIAHLTNICRALYLNELTSADASGSVGGYMFLHDYPDLFARHGFEITDEGDLEQQHWYLFTRTAPAGDEPTALTNCAQGIPQ